MSLFNEYEKLIDYVEYGILLEVVKGAWTLCDDEVRWEEDGDIYNGLIIEGTHTQDDAVFINIDNECGETITNIFIKHQQLGNNEFEDKFGDW